MKEVLTGRERILQEEFVKFQSFYCFESEFCGPAKGNEKGMVENLVKYVENNYFLPRVEFKSFDILNMELKEKCQQRFKKGRHEKGSILINSNLEFAEWGKIFHDERMTAAIIDRLIHNSKIILFNGESYRYRNRRQGIKGN